MSRELFPKEIINSSSQHHIWQFTVHSQILYSSVLLFLIGSLAALPFLYVDVSVKSRGIIRPVSKIKVLTSPVTGRIALLGVNENGLYPRGTLIARVESPLLEERLDYNHQHRRELDQYIRDLKLLVSMDSSSFFNFNPAFETSLFSRTFLAFREELQRSSMELNNARELYQRQQFLYENEAVSYVQLKESELTFNTARGQQRLLFEQQLEEWESRLTQYRQEREEGIIKERQLKEELRQYEIFMPITGTIQNLAPVLVGSYIQAGQKMADISPDTSLAAECFITPGDIGLLRKGMEVRFQVDAFDYNRWGTVTGRVTDISNDALMNDNQPLFLVRTALDQAYLELPNGYRGYLKKGMTLQAHFLITRRSLFQLIYDNVNEWLNPIRDQGKGILKEM